MSATMDLLKTQQGPIGSATSSDDNDSVIVDPTVRYDFFFSLLCMPAIVFIVSPELSSVRDYVSLILYVVCT